jgi:hypothetical protein
VGALQNNLADGGGALFSPRVNLKYLDGQRVTDLQVDVWKHDVLPASCVREMDYTKGLPVVQKADLLDASKILEGLRRVKASIGNIDAVEGRCR